MESTDEVTRKTLELLQSSDFTKTLESFHNEMLKPTINIMAKKIVKAKKKLKKLQKRQRKQDKQGVSNTADQWLSDTLDKFLAGENESYVINMIKHAKITEQMMDAMRSRYGIGIKPKIVGQMTIDEFIKWRDNTKTQSFD